MPDIHLAFITEDNSNRCSYKFDSQIAISTWFEWLGLTIVSLLLILVFGATEAHANSVCSIETSPKSTINIAKYKFERECPTFVRRDCDDIGNGVWQCSSAVLGNGAPASIVPAGNAAQPSTSAVPVASMPVRGSMIILPADGWYQIQNGRTYKTVYEGSGGKGHQVPDGTYTVINLTTQTRFENLVVSTGTKPIEAATPTAPTAPVAPVAPVATASASTSTVTVEGSNISLPSDGWYQIQNAGDYKTLYEGVGGKSVKVAAGRYNVINLTSNIRTENLVVSQGSTPPPPILSPAPAAPSPPPPQSAVVGFRPVCEISTVASNNQITFGNNRDSGLYPGYSRRQSVNADETKLLLTSSSTKVYDIVNGRTRNKRDIDITSEVMWSESDPNVLYGVQRGIRFGSYDLSTNTFETFYDLQDAGVDSSHRFTIGDYEGHVQKDRYVVLRMISNSRGTDKLISLEFGSGSTSVLGEMETPDYFDWAGFSPDAKTIVIASGAKIGTYSVHDPDFSFVHGPVKPRDKFSFNHSDWVVTENGESVFAVATNLNNSIFNPRNNTWNALGTSYSLNGISNSGHISGLASKKVPGVYLASDTSVGQDSYIVKLNSTPENSIDWFVNIGQIWGGTNNYRDQTKGTISPTGKYITYSKPVNGQAQTFLMTMDNSRCPLRTR